MFRTSIFSFLLIFFSWPLLSQDEFQTITIKPGQTLWDISNKYLKDPTKWDVLVKYNNMSPDPSRALPGMTIKVPVSLLKEEYRAAKFTEVVNDVRFRKKEVSDWKKAGRSDEVFNGDTVRTNVDSMADLRFYTGQVLNIFSNSMLVVRPPKEKDSDIRLMTGQIRAVNSRVITPTAKIVPKTANTEFGARIKEDLSTAVEVYKGVAGVSSPKGKEVEIREGFSTEVKLNMEPSKPIKMEKVESLKEMKTRIVSNFQVKLATSAISSIPSGQAIKVGSGAEIKISSIPSVKIADVPQEGYGRPLLDSAQISSLINIDNSASGYRVQASRDKNFAVIVFDRKYDVFTKPDLSADLPKGVYWVRYSVLDLLGDEGKFSEPRPIRVK